MDEVKKRKDLKSIMIIGAGPIVIGQVCAKFGKQRHPAGFAGKPRNVSHGETYIYAYVLPAGLRV
jgi:hypothetical protein